ncbi:phage tail tube protein [Paenibacillus alba]|uniref:Phage tail tube protein n=1 Tax=Paenibacillus alba TaxID=1197127 RepID=A0ABU6G555_9BACL|nr:phage tail tube protein [Paenibacillus alba]MEC0229309.1 phage tail tube protein [Paenibacillus alba]
MDNTYFDMQITNSDPSSTIGEQVTILKNHSLFDIESESMEEEVSFTFDEWDMPTEFVKPELG